MEEKKKKRQGEEGRQSLTSADMSTHDWGRWVEGLGVGGLVLRNTAGAKVVRAGLYLTSPTCGLHLGRCVHSISSLTEGVSQNSATDLLTTQQTVSLKCSVLLGQPNKSIPCFRQHLQLQMVTDYVYSTASLWSHFTFHLSLPDQNIIELNRQTYGLCESWDV